MRNFFLSAASTANLGADVAFTVIMILLTVAVLFTAIWLIAKFINAPKGVALGKFVIISVSVGVVIRVLCAVFVGGYRPDFTVYNTMLDYFIKNGVAGYYEQNGVVIYPLAFYLIAAFGGLGKIFGIASGSAYLSLMIKIPFVIADVITAVLLYKIAKRYINSQIGVVLSGLYCVCPLFFTASAIWGSALTLLVPMLIASFYFLAEKKHFLALLFYSFALITAKEAMYLYPLFLIYYGYLFVRSIVKNAKNKVQFADALKDGEYSLAYKLPVYFIGMFLIKYLLALPLTLKDFGANPFGFIHHVLLAPIASLDYFSYNGLSIFNIFGKNAEPLSSSFPDVIFTVCFGVLVAGIVAVVYFSKKNRAVLPLLAAYVLYTLATYFLDSAAMSVLPVAALLLFAFIYMKDRRILQIFSVVTLVMVITSLTAFVTGGYFNMLDASAYVAPSYTGSVEMTEGFPLVVLIICSVISVAAHLYMTLVTFDITMSNNRKLMNGKTDVGYFEGIKYLFK